MSPDRPQSFANHRALPPGTYVVGALAYVAFIGVAAWQVWQTPSLASVALMVLGLVLVTTHFYARRNAQIVQDRVICLEMSVRLGRLMPGDERWRQMQRSHLIALRFASDAEIPALIDRDLKGEFAKADDLKRAITSWQADWLRV